MGSEARIAFAGGERLPISANSFERCTFDSAFLQPIIGWALYLGHATQYSEMQIVSKGLCELAQVAKGSDERGFTQHLREKYAIQSIRCILEMEVDEVFQAGVLETKWNP